MPHKIGIENCYREQYLSGGNIEWPCGGCQSCKARNEADKISKEHVPGKFCKQSNNCNKCQHIKYLHRTLRHIGGTCNNSRRCEMCTNGQFNDLSQKYLKTIKRTVIQLYFLMLEGETYPWINKIL
jgi:hypothetical protein